MSRDTFHLLEEVSGSFLISIFIPGRKFYNFIIIFLMIELSNNQSRYVSTDIFVIILALFNNSFEVTMLYAEFVVSHFLLRVRGWTSVRGSVGAVDYNYRFPSCWFFKDFFRNTIAFKDDYGINFIFFGLAVRILINLLLLVTHLELLILVVVVLLLSVVWQHEFVTFILRFNRVKIHLIEINLWIYVVIFVITVDL